MHFLKNRDVYVDADNINKSYINKESEESGIVIVDNSGDVVFSSKDSWQGKSFFEEFEKTENTFYDNEGIKYVYSSYDSDIKGWKNIVYFNAGIIKNQAYSLFALILIVAIALKDYIQ